MRVRASALLGFLALALAAPAPAQSERDPAGRVARIAYVEGEASFAPAGVQEWAKAILNRPLIAGDRLYTEARARLELELGASALRLDERSAAEILDLDDEVAQFFLSEGRANLYVRRIFEGQVYEIATPVAAVVVRSPASLTVEVPPGGGPLRVAVWHGHAEVVGDGRRIALSGGEELLASDRSLADHLIRRDPREGDFERFAFARDREFDRAASLRYVPDDLIGYRELDRHGSWTYVREYGPVWFPSRVSVGWTPYRYGHWAWLPVYGWTWIDDAPWGFAVSHYGRWIWWGGRWGWVPCPRRHRAYWAPALVVFSDVGNWSVSYASAPIGWFPLGPGDIWLPWYTASWHYFHRVNVWNTWIGHGTILDVYNTVYVGGSGVLVNLGFRFRSHDFAWTFVPGENFRRGRPVHRHLLPVRREDIARAELRRVLGVLPTASSMKGAASSARGVPDASLYAREAVVTRHPSPRAAALPFAESSETQIPARSRGLMLVGEGDGSGRGLRSALPSTGEGAALRGRGASSLTAGEQEPGSLRGRADLVREGASELPRRGVLGADAATGEAIGTRPARGRAPTPSEISERRAGALGEGGAWREGAAVGHRRGLGASIDGRPAGGRWSERAASAGDSGAEGLGLSSRARGGASSDPEPLRGRHPSPAVTPFPRSDSRGSGVFVPPRGESPARAIEARPYRSPPGETRLERRPGSLIESAPPRDSSFRGGGVEIRSSRPAAGGWQGVERAPSPRSSWEPAPDARARTEVGAGIGTRSSRGFGAGHEGNAPPFRGGAIELAPRERSHPSPARGGWGEPAGRSFRADPPASRGGWESAGSVSRGDFGRSIAPSAPPPTEIPRGSVHSDPPVRESARGQRDEER